VQQGIIGLILLNVLQSYSESVQQETVAALYQTQEHIEADLHSELRAAHAEIQALKAMLALQDT
jgi:hypothetical protein